MKYLLLLFLALSNHGFGQFSNELEAFRKETAVAVKLPEQFKQETRQTKQRFLRKEYNDTNSLFCQGKLYAKNFSEFSHRYDTSLYVHDFDLDGDYDILLFGRLCPGYENTDAVIFFKNRNEYIPQQLGNWITYMNLTRKSTELVVMKTPCCDDHQIEYMYYESNPEVKDSIRQYSHQIFGLDHFDMPLNKVDTVLHISSYVKIMDRPDNTPEDLKLYDEIEYYPVIGVLNPGIDIRAYNSYIHEGKVWYYVIANAGSEADISKVWTFSSFGEIKAVRGWICLE